MASENAFWGAVVAAVAFPAAVAAGFAKGTYDAVSGNGSFTEGCNQVVQPVMNTAELFGREHGEAITKGLIQGVTVALGGAIVKEGIKHVRN